jgi:hypothetical protein
MPNDEQKRIVNKAELQADIVNANAKKNLAEISGMRKAKSQALMKKKKPKDREFTDISGATSGEHNDR